MDIQALFQAMQDLEASDLHLKPGAPPVVRIHGDLHPLRDEPVLSASEVEAAFQALASEGERQSFAGALELDFSYELPGTARYRINAFVQQGQIALAIRRVSLLVPALDDLGLPEICASLAGLRSGLILITGPTGSGKSTTLAAMVDHINQTEARRIVTIEDPIEYVYADARSLITQRELGRDTHSFAIAARQALRQDPDVLLVGEMRDRETMAACLTAAETGHLVLSTLHTNSGPQTIDRVIDAFPPHQQGQIRMQLSLVLQAVLSQLLLPRRDATGRVAGVEVMMATPAIRNLIREGKTHQMPGVIQTGRNAGMQTLDQALKELVLQGWISPETALSSALEPESFRSLLAVG